MRTGLDRLASGDKAATALVRGRRCGLLCHAASVDHELRPAWRILQGVGAHIETLFAPEHGLAAAAQDMEQCPSTTDPLSGLQVYSLYGGDVETLSPRQEWLDSLDVMVIDLQDVGARYYTFLWTAALALRAAWSAGITTVVLDRPNPLGGDLVEGAPQRDGYLSFVGLYPVAVRHGLSLGEACEMVRRKEGMDQDALTVVPMTGWKRTMTWEQTGLPWVLPSPNMPTPDTARVYPGACLLEGTNLSEGRGHTRPFEIFGAPFVNPETLVREVQIDGARLRPLFYKPTFHKFAGKLCGGVQVHVTEPSRFRAYESYLRLIAQARAQAPAEFRWRQTEYEFVADRPAIDVLTGGSEYRLALENGAPLEDVLRAERAGAEAFARCREPYLLY